MSWDGCHLGVWGLLAVIALALIASLVMNFIYCASTRHQVPRPIYRSVQELQSPVVQEVDDYPIYGNLIQDNAVENESCYEAMTSTNRCKNETQVAIENQMCYASLDLSMKQKRRHQKIEKKTNSVKSNMNVDNLPTHSHMLISKPRIYLNSGQINHNEGRREEPIQNEPFILYGEINTSHSKLSISDTSMTFDNTINY